ncbi:arsenic transporter [Tuberibacillus sp. Marseille-P3662]|uniref:arsenic transporter n=1 Tax=Tuberibacillus sp. Marseille-P3662 TaxID=1965358 RepID=UPI000A1CBB9A|nr:arsenic transporter [Tuberibacillus sp. Marseille-P3662]
MSDYLLLFALTVFSLSIFFMIWNPWRLSETVPTAIGAGIYLLFGIVPLYDVLEIFNIVRGASITIISTIAMSIVLESIGFFHWVAFNIVKRAKCSGIKLFLYINSLCYLMTLFFNNDGSILITTPIIIRTVNMLNLKPHQKIAYLLPGALTATAASAPIAISNIANLIALKIVGLDINSYVALMFVPSMIGIVTICFLLYLYFRRDIPKTLPNVQLSIDNYNLYSRSFPHPLSDQQEETQVDWWMFRLCLLVIVITRGTFFILSPLGVPIEWIALSGAFILIMLRWYRNNIGVRDVIRRTPWHILLFAFSMYILVYGLKNIGLTVILVNHLTESIQSNPILSIFTMGGLITLFSNVFNNLPAVMIGTLTLTEMSLDPQTLQIAYLANIIGSDIGSLLTPVGTLATLLWMFILKENDIPINWKQYFKVTIFIIPIGLLVSLTSLYYWTNFIMN